MKLTLDLNKILIVIGGLAVMAPDLVGASTWFASKGVPWMTHVAHALGYAAGLCAGLAIAIPRLRGVLATLGLATAPGTLAPWKPATGPVIEMPLVKGGATVNVLPIKQDGTVQPPTDDKTPVTVPFKRDNNSGAANLPGFIWGTIIAALVALAIVLLTSPARAETPTRQYGGCIVWQDAAHTACRLEAGPTFAVTVGRYEDGKFSAGLLPGIGYGLVLNPSEWYAVGLAAYGQLMVGGGQNQAALSGLFSVANYIRFGIGQTWIEQPAGPAVRSTAYLFGLGTDFGGSPSYVKALSAEAR
jgi:hypothetical protein